MYENSVLKRHVLFIAKKKIKKILCSGSYAHTWTKTKAK